MGRLGSGPASSVRLRVRTPRLGSIKARNAGYIVPVFSCGRSLYIDCRMMIGGNILRHVKREGNVRVGKCPGGIMSEEGNVLHSTQQTAEVFLRTERLVHDTVVGATPRRPLFHSYFYLMPASRHCRPV